jgi:hypothetical protein
VIARAAIGALALAACAGTRSAPVVVESETPTSTCTVGVTHPAGAIVVDGMALPDFSVASLGRVLGAPDRVERVEAQQGYEESGAMPDDPWTSDLVTVTDLHYVYDRRGLVFRTRNGPWRLDEDPVEMLVFFANPLVFDHDAPPDVTPADRGACRLEINGVAVDPTRDARPPGISYQTEEVPLYGTTFAPTSTATQIDSLYTTGGVRGVRLYLDAPATGRPAYAVIQ